MAGLLDSFFGNADQTQALGLLGAGLMNRNFSGGAQAAMQHMAGAGDREAKRQYQQMQMGLLGAQLKETEWQAKEREAKILEMKRKQDTIERMFPSGIGAPEVSPGAFAPSPSQAGPMGPTMPPSMSGMAAPGSRFANMGIDQLAALKMAGLDLTDLHKYANDPMKLEQGATYRSRVDGSERFMPKVGEGMAPGQDGFYAPLPGYAQGQATIEGAKARATEGAKAEFGLERVYDPEQKREVLRPRSQVLTAAQPAARPASASEAALRPLIQGGMGPDPQAIAREIQKTEASLPFIKDAASKAQLTEYLAGLKRQALTAGPMAAGPSAGEEAAAAGAKVKAEADARAASGRDDTQAKKSNSARDMMGQIQEARILLEGGATGSAIGAGKDRVMGWMGKRDQPGINADKLETIGGWLTMNTPRMEGPQSNYDQELYRTMAGRVGDRSFPAAGRLAALETVEGIQKKYAAGGEQPQAATQQASSRIVNELPKTAPKGARARDTVSGEIKVFNGMSWVTEKK